MNRARRVSAPRWRALMTLAVLAGALALGGCLADEGYELPSKAMKELSPQMLAQLQAKNMPKESPILVRIFKEESELEVWKQDTSGRYALLKVYPICRWSGDLGPKVKEGDRQAPEGFYAITPGLMNPNSSYYLAINTGFPNAYDRANNRHGAFLMIHGDCSSRGCYAMTDEQIGEIYSLGREAFLGGQKEFQIQAYPFRMTPANLARHRNSPNLAFWKMIKEGYDHFAVSHLEPKIDVCDRHYVFDAVPPAGSTRPLNFTPTGRCPQYDIDPTIAEAVQEKQRHDEVAFADLVKDNVAVAPLETGTDGGMNRVFASKLDSPTYTYDNEGHMHVPPQQPGRLPPALSPPRGSETETTAAIAQAPALAGSGVRSFFSGLFSSGSNAEQQQPLAGAPVRAANAGVVKPKPQLALRERPAMAAGLRPKAKEPANAEPTRPEPQLAQTAKPAPQQQAAAFAPPSGGLISGAQPVVPAGSFNNRWGLQ
ncbi:MAG TPA: murein L,D-transpeptidase family protein [Xanthobacteraceae bacterium]|nr:murein L,D-transpeptidase family protein [Xanthobacteraceae bacterium]